MSRWRRSHSSSWHTITAMEKGKGNTYKVGIEALDSANKSLASTELVLGKF